LNINKKEENNFNFIRLLAAFLVFYGHSYVFLGTPITFFLNHELGILIFFSISGYLILLSWDRDPSILPTVFIGSAFVITMIFTALSWHYVENPILKMKPKV